MKCPRCHSGRFLHRIRNNQYHCAGCHEQFEFDEKAAVQNYVEARIEKAGVCWIWQKSFAEGGYGQCSPRLGETRAHRLAYRAWIGELSEGLDVHHRCGVRPCVNPEHLVAMSHDDHSTFHAGSTSRHTELRMSFVKWE